MLAKVALKFLINASKLFKSGDWCSQKGANDVKIMPINNMLIRFGLGHLVAMGVKLNNWVHLVNKTSKL
jgi:hypothetical protein